MARVQPESEPELGGPRLDEAQLRQFHEDGWLIVKDAVPRELVREARRQINASLGADGLRNDSPDRTSSGNTRVRGAFDDLGRTPVILDLMRGSDVQPLLESALGAPIEPVNNGQIRLCFPAEDGATVDIDMGVRNDNIPFNGWNGHVKW